MTIYIAVCDDNVADRKQSERLLEREKDQRLKNNSDVLYIDSFGSEEALMHTPVKYDIFIIDITDGSRNGMDIAKSLRKKGILAPIVLYSSTVDYSTYVNAPNGLIFLKKPINAGQISHLIDVAGDWTKSKTPLIEIRGQKETYFTPYTEVIRAVPKGKFVTEISLADGSYVTMADSIDAFKRLSAAYNSFTYFGKDIVNILHIESFKDNGFYLSNGEFIKCSFTQKDAILKTYVETLAATLKSNKH